MLSLAHDSTSKSLYHSHIVKNTEAEKGVAIMSVALILVKAWPWPGSEDCPQISIIVLIRNESFLYKNVKRMI